LLRPTVDEDTGEIKMENDLSDANLDVTVDVGPSFTSQRAAIVRSLTGMMAITQDPQAQQVLQSVAIMNMEGEGLSDVRNFFRKKMVEAGVVQPTEEEMMQMQAAMANQQPDPNAVFLQAAAEEAMAKAAGARAGVVKTVADAELARAKTMSTLSSIDLDERAQLIKLLETLTAKDANVMVTPVPPGLGSMSSEITQQVAGLPMDIQGEFIERLSNQ
jgi:hypothetical protein